jgi:hypothetical protein
MGLDFVVRTKVLKELSNPEWAKKMDGAKAMKDAAKVIQDFCRAKGYEVRRLENV